MVFIFSVVSIDHKLILRDTKNVRAKIRMYLITLNEHICQHPENKHFKGGFERLSVVFEELRKMEDIARRCNMKKNLFLTFTV